MDQRSLALGTGAVLGLALVVGLAFARPFLSVTPDTVAGPLETLPPPMQPTDLARLFAGPAERRRAASPCSSRSARPLGSSCPAGGYAVTTEFGVYAACWGLGAEGQPVALLLDFGIIDPADGG